jgi:hypothetical protein
MPVFLVQDSIAFWIERSSVLLVRGGNMRDTKEVFESHLLFILGWNMDADIEQNFSPDCIVLTSYGVFWVKMEHGRLSDVSKGSSRTLIFSLPIDPTMVTLPFLSGRQRLMMLSLMMEQAPI